MAARYYDDAIVNKIENWLPENTKLRVLKPEDTKHLFYTKADDLKDKPFTLPMISLYRNKDIQLLSGIKQPRSFEGLKILSDPDKTLQFNVIPIKLEYQMDIYTKTAEEGDEYIRNFLFKLINNPKIIITIPYNGYEVQHTANIRVLDTVSDTSDSSERLFVGQFTKWTIQMEIHDAFLFSLPYRRNWKFVEISLDVADKIQDPEFVESSVIYKKQIN